MDDRTFYTGPTGIRGVTTTQWVDIHEGALRFWARDAGYPLEAIFGTGEHEWVLEAAPDAIPQLVAALVADRFGGGCGAISDFEEWCAERSIPLRKTVL